MGRNRETKIELTAYDDLFETDQSREEAKLSKIRDIPISEIDEFPDHPFKVLMDEDMEQLVDSIKRSGVMTPATVRLKEDGRYELISGHRRKKACELAVLHKLFHLDSLCKRRGSVVVAHGFKQGILLFLGQIRDFNRRAESNLPVINHLQDFGYKLGQTDIAINLRLAVTAFLAYLLSRCCSFQLIIQWRRS